MTTEYDTKKLIAEAKEMRFNLNADEVAIIDRLIEQIGTAEAWRSSAEHLIENLQRSIAEDIFKDLAALPREVTTVEELDALPISSVTTCGYGYVYERYMSGWIRAGSRTFVTSMSLSGILPATVLFAPSVTPGGEEQGAEA